jgi:hypothetical protein
LPTETARLEGVKNPSAVRGLIIRVSDQLRCGEISFFEKDPEECIFHLLCYLLPFWQIQSYTVMPLIFFSSFPAADNFSITYCSNTRVSSFSYAFSIFPSYFFTEVTNSHSININSNCFVIEWIIVFVDKFGFNNYIVTITSFPAA